MVEKVGALEPTGSKQTETDTNQDQSQLWNSWESDTTVATVDIIHLISGTGNACA